MILNTYSDAVLIIGRHSYKSLRVFIKFSIFDNFQANSSTLIHYILRKLTLIKISAFNNDSLILQQIQTIKKYTVFV